MASISSANVACGGHAGDETTMEATIRCALRHGVALGAHPGYPDRAGFGRAPVAMAARDLERSVREQLLALHRIARGLGASIVHVKPHGALYHAAMHDLAVAEAIARASRAVVADPVLVGLAGARALDAWRTMGFAVAAEGFADRRYEPDGTLRPRALAGALVVDPAEAVEQALRIARGTDTVCIHGDTPGAPAIARAVRAGLEAAGFAIRPPRRMT
jgi:UPF0271 protein